MEQEKERLWIISKRLFGFIGTILLLFLLLKFAVYFMPFFIAGIIALCIEPIIKFNMNKLKMSRRTSSIIVVLITILLFIALILWGGSKLIGGLTYISKNAKSEFSSFTIMLQNGLSSLSDYLNDFFPNDILDNINKSILDAISNLGGYVQGFANNALQLVLSVPSMIVNVVITILALILFTKDRLNIINLLEYHLPEGWLKKAVLLKKEVFSTLGSYLKVYSKILIITTFELLVAFSILKLIGFKLDNIIWLSFIIAIIDILPILGVGTVLLPWAVWCFITGSASFGVALLVVYFLILIIRQFIEPKLVSNQLGVSPIITLLAMYAGFKLVGFTGLILGPITLTILRCIYAEQIKKGLFKSIFE